MGFYGASQVSTGCPINLRTGEKLEQITDLAIQTAAGELAFTRYFRQSTLSVPSVIGRGWSNNHYLGIIANTVDTSVLWAILPEGGWGKFLLDATTKTYKAAPGGSAQITVNVANHDAYYTLKASDQTFVYDNVGRLRVRRWSNDEAWIYIYHADTDYAPNKLKEVSDGYGHSLQLVYYSGQTGENAYKNGQLWRVGDQTAQNLHTTATGRYVEYDYVPEKANGVIKTNAQALLKTVQDVRGQTWTYQYYGEGAGETIPHQLNFLVQINAPTLNGTPMIRKRLNYTTDATGKITQINEHLGVRQIDDQGNVSAHLNYQYVFGNNAAPYHFTEERLFLSATTKVTTKHYFDGEVYLGAVDPTGGARLQALADSNFRPNSHTDANGNLTQMTWSADGKTLSQVTDAGGNTTQFKYDTKARPKQVTDAQGILTEYTYNQSDLRQPLTVQVKDGKTTLRHQAFTYDTKGRITQEHVIDPADGTTVLHQTTRTYGTSGLLESVTQVDLTNPANNTSITYTYDTAGRVIKTQKSSLLGSCQFTYTVYDPAGNVLATVCGRQNVTTIPTTVAAARALYDDQDPTLFTVTTHQYDALGRRTHTTTNDGSPHRQTTLTFYDELDRVVRTISNYVPITEEVIAEGETQTIVYDPAEWAWNNDRSQIEYKDDTPIPHGDNQDQNLMTLTVYNLQGLVSAQMDPMENWTIMFYNDAGQMIRQVVNYVPQETGQVDQNGNKIMSDPAQWFWIPGGNYWHNGVSKAVSHGEGDENIITSLVYDANGNLITEQDARGQIHFMFYDKLNRLIKTVRHAKDAASILPGTPDANHPGKSAYVASPEPDRDQIEITYHDAMGRVTNHFRLINNLYSTDDDKQPDNHWNTTLYGYDKLGRQVKVIGYAAEPLYHQENNDDPSLASYPTSMETDQDVVSRYIYNEKEQIQQTQRLVHKSKEDEQWDNTYTVYDGLGRTIKTIANYVAQGASDPANWVWNSTRNRWEVEPVSTDVDTPAAVEHGDAHDHNAITETVYDSNGRVQSTRDGMGRQSYNIYDASGRLIRQIANYLPQGTTNPANWVWNSTRNRWEVEPVSADVPTPAAVEHGDAHDHNAITETVYDALGRVQQTLDRRRNVTYRVYDALGRAIKTIVNYLPQGTSDPADWVWNSTRNRWEQSATTTTAIARGDANDQNAITTTTYDLIGQVVATRDPAGIETRHVYNKRGQSIKTIHHYTPQASSDPMDWDWNVKAQRWEKAPGEPIPQRANPDQNRISRMFYNPPARLNMAVDARGTQTLLALDAMGRHYATGHAFQSSQETYTYTYLDKAGKVWGTIQNWDAPRPVTLRESPIQSSLNLSTITYYDRAERPIRVTHPGGSESRTTYFKDGQINTVTDQVGQVTAYRYDGLGRRNRVIQNYQAQGSSDPADWVWNSTRNRWEYSATANAPISHTANNDQNIVVQASHDLAGRMSSLRDPRGNLTRYEYDALNRRTKLTNPLANEWSTAYADLNSGGTRTTQTYPGLDAGGSYDLTREFDRLGRLQKIGYGDPTNTPDVDFSYDAAGNRVSMAEYNNTSHVATNLKRKTTYTYDAARRLTRVGFDTDGNGTVDEAVSYAYDEVGNRTYMTLPGNKTITYRYDVKGQLISLIDWEDQTSVFRYDGAGQHVYTWRPNQVWTGYTYYSDRFLRAIRHGRTWGAQMHLEYQVRPNGDRKIALEDFSTQTTRRQTQTRTGQGVTFPKGPWTDTGGYKRTAKWGSVMEIAYTGDGALLTIGTGPDHGMIDISINGWFWRSFNGYEETVGEKVIELPKVVKPDDEATGKVSIEVRSDNHHRSTDRVFRFKQIEVITVVSEDRHHVDAISYGYDGLNRLTQADGATDHTYAYDRSGNLTSKDGATRTYNAANQLTAIGNRNLTYDANGNLTSDGVNAYTWDRANRLTQVGNTTYTYDGLGNRVSQTVNTTRTDYLLDLQAGLPKVLAATTGTNTERYIHAIRGLHATEDSNGTWTYALEDALGSVRGTIGSGRQFQSTHNYDPYGHPAGNYGAGFGYAGEQIDSNGLSYNRARYYDPRLSVFNSLDPYPGTMGRPMSLNGYSYVEGNTPNRTDPSGKCWDNPGTPSSQQSQCLEAWVNYASGIDLNDPTYRELLRQEDAYWRGLPYQDFTRLWNDNRARPPLSMKTRSNNAGNIMSSAVGVAGTVSFVNPLPGPEDAVAGGILIGGACLAAGAALVGALVGTGTVSLLNRPFYSFRLPQEPPEFPDVPIDPTLGLDQDDYERLGDALVHGVRGAGNLINTFASSTSNTQSQSNTSSSRYGNCTPQQHDALAQIVRDRCKSSIILGCAEKKGLKKLRQRLRSVQGVRRERDVVITRDHIQTIIDDNLACEAARQAVQDTCYPNNPTPNHEKEIRRVQDARQKCQDLLNSM